MNIITTDLEPKTFGEFIDALIIANLRMWHAQEVVYEIETLNAMTHPQMFDFLKQATWLNLLRNRAMDGLDSTLAAEIMERNPATERIDKPIAMEGQLPLWEQV
ncbi:MAG: hypothetical protein HYZ54_06565 [Ignavibacteriae bacterium]|nr:hypothetical protein [Ignavibacteriota bacterium]